MKPSQTLLCIMIKTFFYAAFSFGIFSCAHNPGTGSEIGNARFSAKLYDRGGSPCAGAKVVFVPVGYAPRFPLAKVQTARICSTVTNGKGEYFFDSVPGGTYNIFGEKAGDQSFHDSVPVANGRAEVQSDTLRPPGSLTAHIDLSNGLDYKTLMIIALGSLKFSFVDSTGVFTLSEMAEGSYAVRITTLLDDWETKDTVLSIVSGKDETIKDTIPLAHKNSRPIVKGLPDTTISLNDTISFNVSASDSNIIIQKYYWNFGDGSAVQCDTTAQGTISHKFPSKPMKCTTSVTLADSFGKIGTRKAVINVVTDPPTAFAGKDTTISVNSPILLNGTATQQFGRIDRYAWDFNGDGIWDDSNSTTGTTTITYNTCGMKKAVFGVCDDDGNFEKDTLNILVATFVTDRVIAHDTVWKKESSPYIIPRNTLLDSGYTLTIQPGVIVRFAANTYLRVNGTLSAVGDAGDSIIFTAHTSSPRQGFWDTIAINGAATFKYCKLKYAKAATTKADTVSYCDIDSCSNGLVGNYIEFCSAEYCSTFGFKCPSIEDGRSTGTIAFSRVHHCDYGIKANGRIIGCEIYANSSGIGLLSLPNQIDSCFIHDNITGIDVGGDYASQKVSNSKITHNEIGLKLWGNWYHSVELRVNKCLISENSTAAISFGNYSRTDNDIIEYSIIKNNGIGINLPDGSNIETHASPWSLFRIYYSNIEQNKEYDIKNTCTMKIDATNNYWGQSTSSEMTANGAAANISTIYDYFDDFNMSKVDYSSWLSFEVWFAGPNW
jgi:hypothetical protein